MSGRPPADWPVRGRGRSRAPRAAPGPAGSRCGCPRPTAYMTPSGCAPVVDPAHLARRRQVQPPGQETGPGIDIDRLRLLAPGDPSGEPCDQVGLLGARQRGGDPHHQHAHRPAGRWRCGCGGHCERPRPRRASVPGWRVGSCSRLLGHPLGVLRGGRSGQAREAAAAPGLDVGEPHPFAEGEPTRAGLEPEAGEVREAALAVTQPVFEGVEHPAMGDSQDGGGGGGGPTARSRPARPGPRLPRRARSPPATRGVAAHRARSGRSPRRSAPSTARSHARPGRRGACTGPMPSSSPISSAVRHARRRGEDTSTSNAPSARAASRACCSPSAVSGG